MQNLYLAMTIGNDPHTEGVKKSGRIAEMLGIPFMMLPPSMSDEDKVRMIKREKPVFLGLSYRLSPDKALFELRKFLDIMRNADAFRDFEYISFAGLLPTLNLLREYGIAEEYKMSLMGSYSDIKKTTANTIDFFRIASSQQREEIIEQIYQENNPPKIKILDEIARDVVEGEKYLLEEELPIPSENAKKSILARIAETKIPVIRTHFGIPSESIEPTVKGIETIAKARVIDELSLGSSDLSQRFYGHPDKFVNVKNDGGVPYKDRNDLEKLFIASRTGNYPAMKPYCHVKDLIPFIDECISLGLLIGGHQAIPLFWFNELDGRGPDKMEDSIDIHLRAIKYLAELNIPTEINDPNQWSSRLAHDAVFVTSYCLISSVMYSVNTNTMVLQCQFNKPATTGDYADLAKFYTAQKFVKLLCPRDRKPRILYESRGGIEHFSSDLNIAKFQLARTTLLQMMINPSILHLVSYCEADHAATAEDVIESSKILRRAVRLFEKNKYDIMKSVDSNIISERSKFLEQEVGSILDTLVSLVARDGKISMKDYYMYLSQPTVLKKAMEYRIMSAPGIATERFSNPSLLTKVGKIGELDCYRNWDDAKPFRESERLTMLKKEFSF